MTELECWTLESKWLSETTFGKTATLLRELRKLRENVKKNIADQDNVHGAFMQDIFGYYEKYNSAITNASELATKFQMSMRDVMVLLEEPSFAELELAKQFLAVVKTTDDEMQQAIVEGEDTHFFPSQRMGVSLMTFLNSL